MDAERFECLEGFGPFEVAKARVVRAEAVREPARPRYRLHLAFEDGQAAIFEVALTGRYEPEEFQGRTLFVAHRDRVVLGLLQLLGEGRVEGVIARRGSGIDP